VVKWRLTDHNYKSNTDQTANIIRR